MQPRETECARAAGRVLVGGVRAALAPCLGDAKGHPWPAGEEPRDGPPHAPRGPSLPGAPGAQRGPAHCRPPGAPSHVLRPPPPALLRVPRATGSHTTRVPPSRVCGHAGDTGPLHGPCTVTAPSHQGVRGAGGSPARSGTGAPGPLRLRVPPPRAGVTQQDVSSLSSREATRG